MDLFNHQSPLDEAIAMRKLMLFDKNMAKFQRLMYEFTHAPKSPSQALRGEQAYEMATSRYFFWPEV